MKIKLQSPEFIVAQGQPIPIQKFGFTIKWEKSRNDRTIFELTFRFKASAMLDSGSSAVIMLRNTQHRQWYKRHLLGTETALPEPLKSRISVNAPPITHDEYRRLVRNTIRTLVERDYEITLPVGGGSIEKYEVEAEFLLEIAPNTNPTQYFEVDLASISLKIKDGGGSGGENATSESKGPKS